MNEPTHVMTREAAERYKAEFKRATAKWAGQTMEVLPPAKMAEHLAYVKQAQQTGAPF